MLVMVEWLKKGQTCEGGQDDIRGINDHGHSTLAVRDLGTIYPDRVGVVDRKNEHIACGREAAENGIGRRRLARVGEVRTCD